MLLRVLPSLYEKQPQSINSHLKELVALMSQLEQAEQHHLLRVFQVVARRKQPEVKNNTDNYSWMGCGHLLFMKNLCSTKYPDHACRQSFSVL